MTNTPLQRLRVVDPSGDYAEVDLQQYADVSLERLPLYFSNGDVVVVQRTMIAQHGDEYRFTMPYSRLTRSNIRAGEQIVIPVVQEEAQISKREYKRATVRIQKSTRREKVIIDEPARVERVEVQRVPVNQMVTVPPEVRYEGDTMIIPVVQEVVVVEKRLMLVEEIRVTKTQVTVSQPQEIELSRDQIEVERIDHRPNSGS